ncbi:unnamed protein product [Mytilus coruscus]|uniref:DUF5745 domain-containing protein n=1 Tax=Mytilus coruscus TaxID=42192 RepID=A0A6J8EBN8_MYTCO|nr:unnamed protein product [Mytilus coruscus]
MKTDTQDIIDEEIILRANYVFGRINPPVTCKSVDEIDVLHFVSIYLVLTEEEIPGSKNITSERTKQTIGQFMINSIADDILQLPLDHITGKGIVDKDRRTLKDLLDIFIQLIEASDFDPENDTLSLLTDSRTIPSNIRHALRDIEVSAAQMMGSISKLQDAASSKKAQTRLTQTTPTQFMSSSTSPVTWEKVLYNYQDKGKQNKQFESQQPPRRTLGSLSNYSPRRLTKACKPKPVISTKCKRSSPVVFQRKRSTIKARPVNTKITNKENNEQALDDELEKVKERRKEITQQINQLQNEDQRLQTLQSIMSKELRLLQVGNSKEPRKLQKSLTRRNPSSAVTRPVCFR